VFLAPYPRVLPCSPSLEPHPLPFQVNSGDKVHFKWNGENMGLYGFYKESDYKKCLKGNLNYMKNTRGSGLFSTKANRSGWRYYAHISGAEDGACKYERKGCHKGVKGSCQAKVKIHWG
jgi:hypothetical protein